MINMQNCVFKPNKTGSFTCKNCGLTVPISNVKANCKLQEPTLIQKVQNFTISAIKHLIVGNPTVKEEQMKERLSICQTCPLFKINNNMVGGICTHQSCGCTIQDNLNYMNKIAWADQECPIGKWSKIDVSKQ